MGANEEKEKRICPRCKGTYNWLNDREIGNQKYRYAIHSNKGKVVKQCYLGPIQGYIEVTGLHESLGMDLKGLVASDEERIRDYLDGIISSISDLKLDKEILISLADRFKRMGEELENYAAKCASVSA